MALIDQKKEIEKARIKNQAVYIACMVWGKDPDEFEQQGGPLVGVDIPASAGLVSRLF